MNVVQLMCIKIWIWKIMKRSYRHEGKGFSPSICKIHILPVAYIQIHVFKCVYIKQPTRWRTQRELHEQIKAVDITEQTVIMLIETRFKGPGEFVWQQRPGPKYSLGEEISPEEIHGGQRGRSRRWGWSRTVALGLSLGHLVWERSLFSLARVYEVHSEINPVGRMTRQGECRQGKGGTREELGCSSLCCRA